jgi:serine/threonine-protein kinase
MIPLNSMTPEHLQRIRAIYEAAVDTPVAARAAMLDRECNGDDSVRQEVERLLAAREHLPDWLSKPMLGDAAQAFREAATVTQPVRLGQVNFQPGAILANRYRIIYLLGRGGMGEVYRADDLTLGQTVALKFLPTASASMLSRFRNEVRTARQVSHPNVCRVHDIGEAEGLTFLSMEYVDGEDLASLLRRIGKFPQDKALEIARQLCAGLAAAHSKGVIHRDLKPANIMLDGQGHVRITDFGIAGMVERIRDVGSGTPAYMSPEQLAGKDVTPRSDIYALGIVLCELLTGKRPPLKSSESDSTAVDPAVRRLIERCLDPDPTLRPDSAIAVAAALPGTDPLAAALAAGETPSPELVAAAGPVEGLHPAIAVSCLVLVILGVIALCILRQKNDFVNQIPMENSSEVLASKAREIVKSFGYVERPADSLLGWSYDTEYLRYAAQQKGTAAHARSLLTPYPPAVYFWYRQSLRYPSAVNTDDDFTVFRRVTLEPGTQALVLDSDGKLLELHVRPPIDLPRTPNTPPFEWSRLFAAAGLDPARFQQTEPELTPATPFDAQAAWTGSWSSDPQRPLRIEAAAYRGKPVFFRVLGPWMKPGEPPGLSLGTLSIPEFVASVIVFPAVAGLLAWRNARSGRGDRRGAFRLAGFIFVCVLIQGIADTHHIAAAAEFVYVFASFQTAVFFASFFWVLYMAFEPQVRRRYPEALISWSRLLGGRLRDPLIGAHVLIGIILGICGLCISDAFLTFPILTAAAESGTRAALPWSKGVIVGFWCFHAVRAVGAMGYMFMLNLISAVIRRKWAAASLFILVSTLALTPYATGPWLAVARSLIFFAIIAFALTKFGVLTAAAAIFAQLTFLDFPLTTNWSAWYAQNSLITMCAVTGLALYGAVTTLGGRPIRWTA